MERLQKVIANNGIVSRRKAEELIISGKVTVDGKIIRELGTKVSGNEVIEVDGRTLENVEKVYYLLNKPRGVVTTTKDELNRKTVINLIPDSRRIYPVGRLDYDTTGLLIITNDGDFANHLMHPSNKIEKVYIAKINGIPTPSDLMALKKGVIIDGKKTSRARAKLKTIDKKAHTSIVELTIHEGRNHQVKKMFEAVGLEVLKLKRERIAFLTLDGLKSGEFRILNPKEVKQMHVLLTTKQKESK